MLCWLWDCRERHWREVDTEGVAAMDIAEAAMGTAGVEAVRMVEADAPMVADGRMAGEGPGAEATEATAAEAITAAAVMRVAAIAAGATAIGMTTDTGAAVIMATPTPTVRATTMLRIPAAITIAGDIGIPIRLATLRTVTDTDR